MRLIHNRTVIRPFTKVLYLVLITFATLLTFLYFQVVFGWAGSTDMREKLQRALLPSDPLRQSQLQNLNSSLVEIRKSKWYDQEARKLPSRGSKVQVHAVAINVEDIAGESVCVLYDSAKKLRRVDPSVSDFADCLVDFWTFYEFKIFI
jgi:hypothetical protein